MNPELIAERNVSGERGGDGTEGERDKSRRTVIVNLGEKNFEKILKVSTAWELRATEEFALQGVPAAVDEETGHLVYAAFRNAGLIRGSLVYLREDAERAGLKERADALEGALIGWIAEQGPESGFESFRDEGVRDGLALAGGSARELVEEQGGAEGLEALRRMVEEALAENEEMVGKLSGSE